MDAAKQLVYACKSEKFMKLQRTFLGEIMCNVQVDVG